MARRKRRPNLKLVPKAPDPILHRPPQGEYEEELIGGGHGHAKRLRRIDEHPLTKAYFRGQLGPPKSAAATDRFTAGEMLRRLCGQVGRSMRDSTDFTPGGGSTGLPWTISQENAIRKIQAIESRMSPHDYIIARKLCGEGCEPIEAIRAANIVCGERDTIARLCAAMDNLVYAVSRGTVQIAA